MNTTETIPPPLPGPQKPRVVTFYRVWCAVLAIAYLGIGGYEFAKFSGKIEPRLGFLLEVASAEDPALTEQLIAEERRSSVYGIVLAVVFATVMLVGLLSPRASWSWGYGFAPLIVSLLPFCFTLAAVIPLLIFWVKPETKRYFQIRP